jgi:hypothetical protein
MGMHVSLATHICGGNIAAIKLSFTGEEATCGMENSTSNTSTQKTVTSDCCQNHVTSYLVDNNYNPTSYQFQDFSKNLVPVFITPSNSNLYSNISIRKIYTNVSPPGVLLVNNVSLSDICVYRI